MIAGAMTALTLSMATDARAASERVRVRAVNEGVLIRVFSDRARAVDFTLGGRRLDIGPSVRTGVNCEWADPGWGGIPGCTDVLVVDSVFVTSLVGVYLDEGTTRTTVRDSVFRSQRWAAIGDHLRSATTTASSTAAARRF